MLRSYQVGEFPWPVSSGRRNRAFVYRSQCFLYCFSIPDVWFEQIRSTLPVENKDFFEGMRGSDFSIAFVLKPTIYLLTLITRRWNNTAATWTPFRFYADYCDPPRKLDLSPRTYRSSFSGSILSCCVLTLSFVASVWGTTDVGPVQLFPSLVWPPRLTGVDSIVWCYHHIACLCPVRVRALSCVVVTPWRPLYRTPCVV